MGFSSDEEFLVKASVAMGEERERESDNERGNKKCYVFTTLIPKINEHGEFHTLVPGRMELIDFTLTGLVLPPSVNFALNSNLSVSLCL